MRLTSTRGAVAGALVLLCAGLAGCGPGTADDTAGFGLPIHEAEPSSTVEEVSGTLRVESNGCFTLEVGGTRPWVVWPPGSSHDGDQVLLADGEAVADGDRLTGTGTLEGADALPDWTNPDSYFHSFGTFCEAEERGVVLLTQVQTEQ